MKYKQPIKFIEENLTASSIIFFSENSAKDIYEEMKSILDKSNNVFHTPNLSGQIDSNYNFIITHKVEFGNINIGGFDGMSAELKGQITEEKLGSKIIVTIQPNSAFALLFLAFFLGGLIIIFFTIFSLPNYDNSFITGLFSLFIFCPILLLISYNVKKSLVDTFVRTFKLTIKIL